MADSPTYRVPFRRRREKKTDYAKRLALVKSGKVRLVVRKSNSSIYAQAVEFFPEGDRTIAAASGKDLAKIGWKGSTGNIPAAYLVGCLLAKRTPKGTEAVFDIGMQRPVKGGRIFAVLKGVVDGGLAVPFDASAFPSEERLQGLHVKGTPELAASFKATKEKISATTATTSAGPKTEKKSGKKGGIE
ncbi:MAG: 50S ribosomal protein L18 [archaeon]